MTNLKDLVEEIERMGNLYRGSDNLDAREVYNQYVELIITDAPKSEQYKLCDYWSQIIK